MSKGIENNKFFFNQYCLIFLSVTSNAITGVDLLTKAATNREIAFFAVQIAVTIFIAYYVIKLSKEMRLFYYKMAFMELINKQRFLKNFFVDLDISEQQKAEWTKQMDKKEFDEMINIFHKTHDNLSKNEVLKIVENVFKQ